jgi:hypothetical protein
MKQHYLSMECRHCGEKLSLPFNSGEELFGIYGALVKLYSRHLSKKHNAIYSTRLLEEEAETEPYIEMGL